MDDMIGVCCPATERPINAFEQRVAGVVADMYVRGDLKGFLKLHHECDGHRAMQSLAIHTSF